MQEVNIKKKDEKEFNIGFFFRNILEDISNLPKVEKGERQYFHKIFNALLRNIYYISIPILLLSILLIIIFQIKDKKIYYSNGKIAIRVKCF